MVIVLVQKYKSTRLKKTAKNKRTAHCQAKAGFPRKLAAAEDVHRRLKVLAGRVGGTVQELVDGMLRKGLVESEEREGKENGNV